MASTALDSQAGRAAPADDHHDDDASSSSEDTLWRSGHHGTEKAVGRLERPSNVACSPPSHPYVFISHTAGQDGVKESIVRPTHWFLTQILQVQAFFNDDGDGSPSCWQGEDKRQSLAVPAYTCNHALVILSPTFRKRKVCVLELNTFMHRWRQRREQEQQSAGSDDGHPDSSFHVWLALWQLDHVKDYHHDVSDNIWLTDDTSSSSSLSSYAAPNYMLRTLWPRLAEVLLDTPRQQRRRRRRAPTERELKEYFVTYVEQQHMSGSRDIPRDLIRFAKDLSAPLPDATIAVSSDDHSSASGQTHSSSMAASIADRRITGVAFSSVYMDDKSNWNEKILQCKDHIEGNLKKRLLMASMHGTVTYGRQVMRKKHKGMLGAAVVRLDCEIELHDDSNEKHLLLVLQQAATAIARILQEAGASDADVARMMIVTAWKGPLCLLLEAPEAILELLFGLWYSASRCLRVCDNLALADVTPAFVVSAVLDEPSPPLDNTAEAGIVIWRWDGIELLLPASPLARGILIAGGVLYSDWERVEEFNVLMAEKLPEHYPSGAMQSGRHQAKIPPPCSPRRPTGVPAQHPQYAPVSPPGPTQRQGHLTGGIPQNYGQYSCHPPFYQVQGPTHPVGHLGQMHPPQVGRYHSNSMGMPPKQNQHGPMRSDVGGRQPSSPVQRQLQQIVHKPPPQQQTEGGNWQSDRDMPRRREMIELIFKLLKKKANNSPESLSRLPQMARHLEVSLYRNSLSLEAYANMSTLKERLRQIAAEVSMKAQSSSVSRASMFHQRESPHSHSRMSPPPSRSQGVDKPVQPLYRSDQMNKDSRPHPSSSNISSKDSMPSLRRPADAGDSEWQKIRHKQQRLLLLRHASRCQYEAGTCPESSLCASIKKLWAHIAHCKDQQCNVQHCLSSRYVLSHYRRCTDVHCPTCGPVRDSIRQSTATEKPMQHLVSSADPPSFAATDQLRIPYPLKVPSSLVEMLSQQAPLPMATSAPEVTHEPKRKRVKTEETRMNTSSADTARISNRTTGTTSDKPQKEEVAKPTSVASKKPAKPHLDHSLLNSFSFKELETHLQSLDWKTRLSPAKLRTMFLEVLKGLQSHQHGWVFNSPVDPVELGLPDYFEIIKKPMDLGTIQNKLDSGGVHEISEFEALVDLTFDNAMAYNENGSLVHEMAKELKTNFEIDMKKLVAQLEREDMQSRQNDGCVLCGYEKLLFKPPVYFCSGINCQNPLIWHSNVFYVGGKNQCFWCSQCYSELDEKTPIELIGTAIKKGDLVRKRNDEVHEEGWVQCDTCERWVHQICGLFNTRQNKEHHSEYCCPRCLCDKRGQQDIPSAGPPGASDLPRTNLSEWLEKHIKDRVQKKKRELAESKAASKNITIEEAMNEMKMGGPIIIRQVTAMDGKLEVRDRMKKRYAHKNYPDEFPFRCKCIVVFQRMDGMDVLVFALYVYEHGENNPPPNQRVVCISYLDSVHFMRPRLLRTFVYHEILIAYLDYARLRGFSTAHIWACPPLRDDDFIFFAKPEDQRMPRYNRLCQWFFDMLAECQKRGVVGKVTNMYDLYFANQSLDATAVPYLEGDYFPGEAENIIKMLEEERNGNGRKKKSKSTKNTGNTGTRSTGVDEELLMESGLVDNAKSLKDIGRDPVVTQLGETVRPMKESFIVAFLNSPGAKKEDMTVSEQIEKAHIAYASFSDTNKVIEGNKRDALGNVRSVPGIDGLVKVIDDDAEDINCEFFNNQQAFLNLCRRNHYQFDHLRRAKHTSMMVLWHLHRDACTHKLAPIAVDSSMTDVERLQHQRSLMLHLQLLEHASECVSKTCPSSNCAKMKNYLRHASICRLKVQGGCRICRRLRTLFRIHAQKCKKPKCPLPHCVAIREKTRQLQRQQHAMDDRRRLEMNRHMRIGASGGS